MPVPIGTTSSSGNYLPKRKKKRQGPEAISPPAGTAGRGGVAPLPPPQVHVQVPPPVPVITPNRVVDRRTGIVEPDPDVGNFLSALGRMVSGFVSETGNIGQTVADNPSVLMAPVAATNGPIESFVGKTGDFGLNVANEEFTKPPDLRGALADTTIGNFRYAYRQLHHGVDPKANLVTKFLAAYGQHAMGQLTAGGFQQFDQEQQRDFFTKMLVPTKGIDEAASLSGYDEDTYAGIQQQYVGTVFSFGSNDHPVNFNDTPIASNRALDYFKSPAYKLAVSELNPKVWETLPMSERSRVVSLTGDSSYVFGELDARSREVLGDQYKGANYDVNDPTFDANKELALRQYILYGQVKNLLSVDPDVRRQSLQMLLGMNAKGEQVNPPIIKGPNAMKLVAGLLDARATMENLGMSETVKDFGYKASLLGRPFGTSEAHARWDYADLVGTDNLPPAASAVMQQERMTLGRFSMLPFEATTKFLESAKKSNHPGVIGDIIDASLWTDQHFNNVLSGMGTAIGWVESRPINTLGNLTMIASGAAIVGPDGKYVIKPECLKGTKVDGFRVGVFSSTSAWAASWNATQGKEGQGFRGLLDDWMILSGQNPDEPTGTMAMLLGAAASGADLWATIKFGNAIDPIVREMPGLGSTLGFKAGRGIEDYVRSAHERYGPTRPEQMPGQTSLTADAEALLKSVDDGGVPGSITSNMKRVASENGIEVTKDMTPNDVVDAIRAKEMTGQTEMGTGKSISESLAKAAAETTDRTTRYRLLTNQLPDGTNIGGWVKETIAGDVYWSKGDKHVGNVLTEAGHKATQQALVDAGLATVHGTDVTPVTPPSTVAVEPFKTGDNVEFVKDTKTESKGVGKVVSYDAPSDTVVVETPDGKTVNTNGALTTKTTEAGVKVAPVETGNRAEEAESFYTDVAGDMRGSGDVIDEPLKNFHPADVTEKMPTIMGETETQTRIAYAMDEAIRRTLTAHDIEVVPGAERGLIEDAFAQLPAKARTEELFANLADVLDERKLWDGVTTAEVDASIAPDVQRLNDNGYPTTQSHSGAAADHPAGAEAMKAQPYVEFAYKDLVGEDGSSRVKKGNIIRAVKDIGGDPKQDIVRQPGGKTFVVHGDVAKLTDALLGARGRAEGTPPFVPEKPVVDEGPAPEVPKAPHILPLMNLAEYIAHHVNDPKMVHVLGHLLGVKDDPMSKVGDVDDLTQMTQTHDVRQVAKLIEFVNPDLNPMVPALSYAIRMTGELKAAKSSYPHFIRAMTTYVAYDHSVPMRDTSHHMQQHLDAVNLGLKNPGVADWAPFHEKLYEIYRSTDANERQNLVWDIDRMVEDNMKREGTWKPCEKLRTRVRQNSAMAFHRHDIEGRAYGEGDVRRVTSGIERDPESEVRHYIDYRRGKVRSVGEDALLKRSEAAFNRDVAQFKSDVEVYLSEKSTPEQKVSAGNRLDRIYDPKPMTEFQVRKYISHLPGYDPRMIATYQFGPVARTMAVLNSARWSLISDMLTGRWKKIVMMGPGFAFRVTTGDEGWRLFTEGLAPGTKRYREARQMSFELTGGRSIAGYWAKKLGAGEGVGLRALDHSERVELTRLFRLDLSELTSKEKKAAEARIETLLTKSEGTLPRDVWNELYDKRVTDMANTPAEGFDLKGPEAGEDYYVAMQDYLKQMAQTSGIRRWVEDGQPDWSRAEIEQHIREEFIATESGQKLLARHNVLDENGRVKDEDALQTLVERNADELQAVMHEPRLRAAMKNGHISLRQLGKVSQDDLWRVPTRIGEAGGFHAGGGQSVFLPIDWIYEKATVPLLQAINGRLRETFFADEYITQSAKLREEFPTMKPEELHLRAQEDALHGANDRTFSTESSYFENANRNLIPFISAYRQFLVYWAKCFVKHPFALSAAYTYNPLRNTTFVHVPGLDMNVPIGFLLPFMFQQPFGADKGKTGLSAILAQSQPSFNPFIASLAAAAAGQVSSGDISGAPLLGSAATVSGALNIPGTLYYGMTGNKLFGHTALLGRLTRPIETLDKRHQMLLRATARPVTEDGVTVIKHDMPWWYRALDFLERPEAVAGLITGRLIATGSADVGRMGEVSAGVAKMQDPKLSALQKAQYRQDHPWFDAFYCLKYENPTAQHQRELYKVHPDLVAWETPATTSSATIGSVDYQTFVDQLNRGVRGYVQGPELDKAIAAKQVAVFGGSVDGVVRYGGDVNIPAAQKNLKAQLAEAHRLAKRCAKDLRPGDPAGQADILAAWKRSVSYVDQKAEYVLNPRIAQWCHDNGIDEAKLNTGTLVEAVANKLSGPGYTVDDKGKFTPQDIKTRTVSATAGEFWNLFARSGLIAPQMVKDLLNGSTYKDAIVKSSVDYDVATRKKLYSTYVGGKLQAAFEYTSNDLNNMGIPAGKAFDAAQARVSDKYFAPGGYSWCKDKYGYYDKRTKAARNDWNAYRAQQLKRVKGGDAVLGGLAETLVRDPYFTKEKYPTFGTGSHAARDQQLWQRYRKETLQENPNMALVRQMRSAFDSKLRQRDTERMRVCNWLAVVGMARNLRYKMRSTYSDYYGGPGNSAASTFGTKLIDQLQQSIEKWAEQYPNSDNLFLQDIHTYFQDTAGSPVGHHLSYTLLDWTYH